jgi:superfamily II DNA or RNA helicase/diadenosine tetraphosphate (Ap4A) HIT family hydrolase
VSLDQPTCPYCNSDPSGVVYEGQLALAIWDKFPISPGHALIIPKRHVASWFEASSVEQLELLEVLSFTRQAIEKSHAPEGYNIGINIGAAAGQTVPHLHISLVPRYSGDVLNPRGSVRHVIPHLAGFPAEELAPSGEASTKVFETGSHAVDFQDAPHQRFIVSGADDPLLLHMRAHIDNSIAISFAVAFVLESGLRLIEPHIVDLLDRGGRLRILTGDYLGVTEPHALFRLIDLEERYPTQTELKVFEAGSGSFHPKSFIFHFRENKGIALVGSSNLTRPALLDGVEWNLRTAAPEREAQFAQVVQVFEQLFQHRQTQNLTHRWIEEYAAKRVVLRSVPERAVAPDDETPVPPPIPHEIQKRALAALQKTRTEGNSAGLVVMATGLGKTWLSAFDSEQIRARRVLFIAHREEILGQAMETFRRTRPNAHLGLYTGVEKDKDAEVLFASVQTLGRKLHLEKFQPSDFDYVIVDEFHHASARTYRRIIDYFEPQFLLGLTATPERTDGGDLLSLCQGNLVFRCDLREGIEEGLLSPFHYFGVPDEVDFANIPWRSNRFEPESLTNAVATQSRAQNALEQFHSRAGIKTLAFCCSHRHADFMRNFFRNEGIRAAAVHSGAGSDPRAASLERLADGNLDIVFAVDMFNEGVDVPDIDTVMMLRPTESRIIWLQQLGRGLRKAEGKDHLRVIDYIGNHRTFLLKPQTLFQLPSGDMAIERLLSQLKNGEVDLPPGCEVTYDLQTIDILQGLLRQGSNADVFKFFYEDFKERNGRRPTASEMFHEGYQPRSVRPGYGSWFGFARAMGDLDESEESLLEDPTAGRFLASLEITRMTKSFKMLVLLAMLDIEQMPGEISLDALSREVRKFASRSAILKRDFSVPLEIGPAFLKYLEDNPIDAWVGGGASDQGTYFGYADSAFRTNFRIGEAFRPVFAELVRELVDYRLSEYVERAPTDVGGQETQDRLIGKVSHNAQGQPIIFLPDRNAHPSLPERWTKLTCDEEVFEANFVKIALNVMRRPGTNENVLPEVLHTWLGPDAGASGTRHEVEFVKEHGSWAMLVRNAEQSHSDLKVGRSYMRADIPPLFGSEFRASVWNQGYVFEGGAIFLLVTMEKEGMASEHQYEDRFLSRELFEWASQNRHTQENKAGQLMKSHQDKDIPVHLFVRKVRKINGKAAPFIYCGDVTFVDWKGNAPITVRWKLEEPLPEHTAELFEAS